MKCSHSRDDLQLPSRSSGRSLQVFLKIMTTFSINCFFSQRASLFLLVERVFIFALLEKINTLDKHRDCAGGLFKILPSAIVRSSFCTRRAEQSPFLDLYLELILGAQHLKLPLGTGTSCKCLTSRTEQSLYNHFK